ncbi:outer membrane protein [Chthonobacter albigriseus]|uniref:outer membrane protein n=1 Tax=Chthonobacter albigriseus TaxID=1683161 RepID=UPI0015EF480D|nr:outer membrane protein [Chthonobacter albigriseus]
MKRLITTAVLVAATLLQGAAPTLAADMPEPIIEMPEPMPLPAAGAWYLRGDIGYKIYQNPSARLDDPTAGSVTPNIFSNEDLDDTYSVGAGVGYKFNEWFRTDVSIDYEGPANFYGRSPCAGGGCAPTFTEEEFEISVWSALASIYTDLGTYNGFTPYLGAGIGASMIRTSSATSDGVATYSGDTNWNFAWALMAGTSYAFNDNWSMDVGYRYLNLGDAKSGLVGTTPDTFVSVEDIQAHEIRVGMRYTFN